LDWTPIILLVSAVGLTVLFLLARRSYRQFSAQGQPRSTRRVWPTVEIPDIDAETHDVERPEDDIPAPRQNPLTARHADLEQARLSNPHQRDLYGVTTVFEKGKQPRRDWMRDQGPEGS
jgi:hypothetical protein